MNWPEIYLGPAASPDNPCGPMPRSSMKLGEMIEGLAIAVASGSPDTLISGITDDSRRTGAGSLFVARTGRAADGRRFVQDAVAAGAAAVLGTELPPVPPRVAVLSPSRPDEDTGILAAHLAERFHGHPSGRLALVGVTGTNGKTTTAHLIQQILNRAGRRCGLIGTVCVDDGDQRVPAGLTTPGGIETSAMLARMVEAGCDAAVMEVSSHALDQGRVAALRFEGAVFTNLTGDHLDYHGTMDAYRSAKARLMASVAPAGWAVINADDPSAQVMARAARGRVVRTTIVERAAECRAVIGERRIDGSRVVMRGSWGEIDLRLPLAGEHNVSNALQAAAACAELGTGPDAIAAGLACAAAPPGRLEPVHGPGAPFAVLVDYAHTDDALLNVLRALRPLVPGGGRLRVVFGCGGDRDRTKRPRMAAVACRLADEVIITSDNPRTEEPACIIEEAWAGVPPERRSAVRRIVDRRAAIEEAVAGCRAGDVLLIAGKGHEDYQIIGTDRRPFDDRRVAREALRAPQREACIA